MVVTERRMGRKYQTTRSSRAPPTSGRRSASGETRRHIPLRSSWFGL